MPVPACRRAASSRLIRVRPSMMPCMRLASIRPQATAVERTVSPFSSIHSRSVSPGAIVQSGSNSAMADLRRTDDPQLDPAGLGELLGVGEQVGQQVAGAVKAVAGGDTVGFQALDDGVERGALNLAAGAFDAGDERVERDVGDLLDGPSGVAVAHDATASLPVRSPRL